MVKLFLNTYSGKPAQEGSKTRSARSAVCSPFPWTPKRIPTTPGAAGDDFWCPLGTDEGGTTRDSREPPAQRSCQRPARAAGAAGAASAPCVLQQTLAGGREGGGLEQLDPCSGKPDARPGTDASSRAIFTIQWMQCWSRSWNWSCCSSQPGWRDPGGSRGPAWNSGTAHTAQGFVPTPSPRVSSSSESTEKSIKSLSTEKPESSSLNDQSFLSPPPAPQALPKVSSLLFGQVNSTHQISCGKNSKIIKV